MWSQALEPLGADKGSRAGVHLLWGQEGHYGQGLEEFTRQPGIQGCCPICPFSPKLGTFNLLCHMHL